MNHDTGILSGPTLKLKVVRMRVHRVPYYVDVDKVKELNNIFNVWIMLNFIICTRDPEQFQSFKTP